ncbi:hypothetical protein [Teichococcus aestuarii]|uniref:Uncharacterized protein n=1 Tax=Teichococcus aestuarii TaxID=568898 RepID=A0A2U1V786_9PROT|nr:hypothetical protein [Pseudoroseomonas aestuarii]PWC29753.1 hypothetical protein CR165_07435 [Pseudoroseomonas aestuarii]
MIMGSSGRRLPGFLSRRLFLRQAGAEAPATPPRAATQAEAPSGAATRRPRPTWRLPAAEAPPGCGQVR